ncbi:hypothetical protein GALMADRAFT_1061509 [Galerina marginata CBS 339.88]|uniref:Uncharacterized protein n=1 Tax=Galerina marginata (strain CBS 339.88) TaxID=685588 RepID=A0A067SJ65_GALM3|nr:hypothetical protein GALMADRAFT_1061509 [Galerina marginata CBS 339.88]
MADAAFLCRWLGLRIAHILGYFGGTRAHQLILYDLNSERAPIELAISKTRVSASKKNNTNAISLAMNRPPNLCFLFALGGQYSDRTISLSLVCESTTIALGVPVPWLSMTCTRVQSSPEYAHSNFRHFNIHKSGMGFVV